MDVARPGGGGLWIGSGNGIGFTDPSAAATICVSFWHGCEFNEIPVKLIFGYD